MIYMTDVDVVDFGSYMIEDYNIFLTFLNDCQELLTAF